MKWIGLTGGIASGKSLVSQILKEKQQHIIDADQISHHIMQIGMSGYKSVIDHFGHEYLNQELEIDRKKLGALVFSNKQARLDLESILHPLIQSEVKTQKEHLSKQGVKSCFYDVPLLFEKHLEQQFDSIVYVYAPLNIQIERMMKRNNFSHDEALIRIKAQLPTSYKVKKSNFCLDNSTNIDDLKFQINELIKKL